MDAADLARWTRFAAKGGIGKCTAVQDCIAESPEDLMFLKDDEITVLMQLPGQSGRYLGYCEGVVGRFQGTHVRFHGKLKRPVMTKRSSSTVFGQPAASSARSSPAPSVTSPRASLAPLSQRIDSPHLAGPLEALANGAQNARASHHESDVLSDPFDLELPSRRSGSVPRPGSDSLPNSRPGPGKAKEAGADSPRLHRFEDVDGDGGSRRSRSRVPDELPGFEMFLPRSRSGSRTRLSSANGDVALNSNSNSPPSSRGQEDEKSDRRRTRVVAAQQHQLSQPSRAAPSSLPDSQSPSPLPTPSSLSQSHPSSPLPPPSPQKSKDETLKPSVRPLGAERQVQVDVKVVDVFASVTDTPAAAVPSPAAAPDHQVTEQPTLEVDAPGLPAADAVSETRPDTVHSEREPEVSSLYDGASLRSSMCSMLSTRSYRSSVFGPGARLAPSPSGSRLSRAESDDGGLGMGIGLTMLQDLADEEEGGDAGGDGDRNEGEGEEVPPTPRPALIATVGDTREPSVHSEANADQLAERQERDRVNDEDEGEKREQNEASEDEGDDEYWDGADIYDNYRYSRYSVMTKMSKRKSRFSMMSKYSVADSFVGMPPIPAEGRVRADSSSLHSPRSPTLASPSTPEERRRHIPPPLNLVKSASSPSALLSPTPTPAAGASSPPPSRRTTTELGISPQPSPLLHTNFASPQTSSSSRATSFGSGGVPLASPAPSVASFSGAGAASALRQRLENERGASPPSPPLPADGAPASAEMGREDSAGRGAGIVVEDDEGVSVTVVPADEGDAQKAELETEDNAVRESIESAVSGASVSSLATSTSAVSDVSLEIRKIQADLASASGSSSSPVLTISNVPPGPAGDQRTPTGSAFVIGPTQPLRIHDRAAQRADPPQEQGNAPPPPPPVQPRSQPPVQQQQSMPASHLRPQLRPGQTLFLPHPNAPGPNPAVLSGQRVSTYGMPPVHEPAPPARLAQATSPYGSLQSTLRMAAASRVGPAGVPHSPTIFGKTVVDIASADGPVAMLWSLQPFPPEPGSRAGSPAASGNAPRRAATAGASPLSQIVRSAASPPPPGRVGSAASVPSGSGVPSMTENEKSGSKVLLRANFSPQVRTVRPRSRSFSGFASVLPSKSDLKERSSEEGCKPSETASLQSLKDAASGKVNISPPIGHSARQASVSNSPPGRNGHSPSPLSLPQNNIVFATPRTASLSKAPPSPLRLPPIFSDQVAAPSKSDSPSENIANSTVHSQQPTGRILAVRQVASVGTLKSDRPESVLTSPPTSIFQPVRRNSGPAETSSASVSSPGTPPAVMERIRRISSASSKLHQRTVSQLSHASASSDLRSTTVSPPLIGENVSSQRSPSDRPPSIKSKLSLSHLRIRNNAAKDAPLDAPTPSPSSGPATPVFEFDSQPETVHIQDAEFEMIRPTMRRVSSEPTSDDSVMERDERPSLGQETRSESPVAGSMRSALLSPIPSPRAESLSEHAGPLPQAPRADRQAEDAQSIEAHRARELKWIAAMSSVPAPQARKSKKIRRLVLEGVPSSVRYLVWAHLTDSKARRIPGVYGQLGRRGRVAATETIERDAVRCFADHPHLQDPKGPLVSLLQTYLTMVPDIEYQTNLALIAGHLLIQSPEEDAFWTFVSMMDLHLRAYFSSRSVQMDADALVFGKAVESLNPQIAKKLFVDMAIPPSEICRTWFSSLFAACLPQDYANRIWDVYLCEGPPFLFRVGLVLLSLGRTAIEAAHDRAAVLALLARPEAQNVLPREPEELISLALAAKLKDDDVRKQRMKVETQLRRQTQSAQRGAAPRLVSVISLPRA